MLRINYLCGRITNFKTRVTRNKTVVICSELTTFEVESPTLNNFIITINSCDLLRINYLCGRITNLICIGKDTEAVVICSELTTFAVESPTSGKQVLRLFCCDLLRINYLCGRITNSSRSE